MKKILAPLIILVFVLSMFSAQALPGTTWDYRKRLTWSTDISYYPDVAVWEDTVHVVWEESPPPDGEEPESKIYYRRSRDGGTTWDRRKRLDWTTSYSTVPAIAVYGSDVHVVWADTKHEHFEVYYRRSRDGGTTWDPKRRLSWSYGGAMSPDIAAYYYNIGGTLYKWVHVVWEGYCPRIHATEIYYRMSADGGSTWTPKRKLSFTSDDSMTPSVDAWTDEVAVAWADEGTVGGPDRIFVKVGSAYGGIWEPKRRVSWMTGYQYDPCVAIWGPHVHIVWRELSAQAQIWYRRNDQLGRPGNWIPPKRLDWIYAKSLCPSIDVHGVNKLHLVWCQWMHAPVQNYVVLYRSSEDGGDHWAPRRRITWDTGASWFPHIAAYGGVSSAELHVVWIDNTHTNWEIYYRRGHFVASP